MHFRTRKESKDSPVKYYSPESSPELKVDIVKLSTSLQGAIPKTVLNSN